jgi:predicted transposase/invertase (TIGR01784 family)
MDINNPHDIFFKETFSDKENTIDFLKQTLPHKLSDKIDYDTLRSDTNTYVDEELREYFSDMVYDCVYNSHVPVKIVLLFEHKSYIPDYPHLQILRYLLNIYQTSLKQDKKLKPVIPIIFYHGTEKWESYRFYMSFESIDETLKLFIPDFNYLLMDLSDYSDKQIINGVFNNVATKIASLLMKNIYDEKKLLKNLVDFLNIGALYFREEKGLRFLEAVIRYLMSNLDIQATNVIKKSIEAISFEGAKTVMTIAESLIEKGIEKGERQKAIDTAKRMLAQGFDVTLISKITDLTEEEIRKL